MIGWVLALGYEAYAIARRKETLSACVKTQLCRRGVRPVAVGFWLWLTWHFFG